MSGVGEAGVLSLVLTVLGVGLLSGAQLSKTLRAQPTLLPVPQIPQQRRVDSSLGLRVLSAILTQGTCPGPCCHGLFALGTTFPTYLTFKCESW